MNNQYKRLIIIFLIAVSLRVMLFIAVGSWQDEVLKERIVVGDASGYDKIAVNLLENNGFSTSESFPYAPDIFRTPMYPFFLAAFYTIFGYKPYMAILFQLIIGSMTCILTYKIAGIFFNEKIAFLAGLLTAFEYSSILYSNKLLTDTLFTFLLIVHIYFLVKFLTTNKNKWLVYSGVFLGVSTLCRLVSVYFFIFLIAIFFLHFRKSLRKGIIKYSILTLVFLLTITPWMVRNYTVSGKFLVSSVQERVWYWHLPRLIKSLSIEGSSSQQIERVPNPNGDPSETRNENMGMSTERNIIDAGLPDAKRYIAGMVRFFTILGSSQYPQMLGLPYYRIKPNAAVLEGAKIAIQKKNILEWFFICFSLSFLIFLYSTMCFGIYAAIREKNFLKIALFISIIAYFVIATGPVSFTERYRLPIMPYIILLSGYGINQLRRRFREYKAPVGN